MKWDFYSGGIFRVILLKNNKYGYVCGYIHACACFIVCISVCMHVGILHFFVYIIVFVHVLVSTCICVCVYVCDKSSTFYFIFHSFKKEIRSFFPIPPYVLLCIDRHRRITLSWDTVIPTTTNPLAFSFRVIFFFFCFSIFSSLLNGACPATMT